MKKAAPEKNKCWDKKERKPGMVRHIATLLGLFLLLSVGVAAAGGFDKKKAAVVAAEKWLALVDNGEYAESWNNAAQYFKAAVEQQQWERSLQAVRMPLGKLISRKIQRKTFKTSLPGAPDGEYVIIQFETAFENKASAIETVTPMMDTGGKWRVSGYYLR